MTTNTTLNAAAESCLALAACLHAVGDDATTLYRVAPFAAAIAQREARDESLEDAAGIWRDMGCAMHPKLPADLVPWRLINAGTINTVRALVGDLAAYLPELRAMYADLDDLAARMAAQPDPRLAFVGHVLAKRAAGVLRGYEFHEEARIAAALPAAAPVAA